MKFAISASGRNSKASPVTTALVLLVLTGHAFVVSATHFHTARQSGPAAFACGTHAAEHAEAQTPTPAGTHEQCLLCRLQHNFVSDLRDSAPVLDAPPAEALGRVRSLDASARGAHLLAPSGRAPPPA
ncbi:MAG TPA: DUF2946 family protein [Pyrinomonadaceae bacterium]|nr:DUF2946 family protein [Pyrinomonadaceae bacterium]